MVRSFCTSGEREGIKGAVHGLACLVAVTMAAYNTVAWCFRRERHLGLNAVVYGLAVGWEVKQTLHHVQRCAPVSARRERAPEPDRAPLAAA